VASPEVHDGLLVHADGERGADLDAGCEDLAEGAAKPLEAGLAAPVNRLRVSRGYWFGMPVDCHETNSIPEGRFAQMAV
jgi:hypothetical protein